MKYPKTLIALMSFCLSSGCLSVKRSECFYTVDHPSIKIKISDPDLTLIQKQIPRHQFFSFERGELTFSTNKTQQTHAILSRHLCTDFIETVQKTPIGKTMRQSEWDKYLKTDKEFKIAKKGFVKLDELGVFDDTPEQWCKLRNKIYEFIK